jgi:hypothetical protein
MKRALVTYAALLLVGFAAFNVAQQAAGQTGPGWISLFDGNTIGSEWDSVGDTNWRVEDGAIVADKRTSQTPAHLVTKTKYKDFQIYVEFWASDDANSGIFIRCNPKAIGAKTCYECNIFDKRPDPSYGTASIVYIAEVNPMPKAGGKWSTMEVTAKGRQLTLVFDGQKTVDVRNGLFEEGHIALQFGVGTVKFRKVEIRPL